MCSEDDEYDGYFIPKGTVVLGNGWYFILLVHDTGIDVHASKVYSS